MNSIINVLFPLTCLLSAPFFGVWDHLVPHVDIYREFEDAEDKHAERNAQEHIERLQSDLAQSQYERDYNKWADENGLTRRDFEKERERRESNWNGDRNDGRTYVRDYEGTCGPPDRDK